jgi:hypothetical protein
LRFLPVGCFADCLEVIADHVFQRGRDFLFLRGSDAVLAGKNVELAAEVEFDVAQRIDDRLCQPFQFGGISGAASR